MRSARGTTGHTQPCQQAHADDLGRCGDREPEIVFEQQRDGIAEVKAEGQYKGRTPTVAWQIDEIRAMHANGLGAAAIARQHICGFPARVYRTLGVVEVPEGS